MQQKVTKAQAKLMEALKDGPPEKIEIDLLRKANVFRMKLWRNGRLVYCAPGNAVGTEIDALTDSVNALAKASLGVEP